MGRLCRDISRLEAQPDSSVLNDKMQAVHYTELPVEVRRQVFRQLRDLVFRTCPEQVQQFVDKRIQLMDVVDIVKKRINLRFINVNREAPGNVDGLQAAGSRSSVSSNVNISSTVSACSRRNSPASIHLSTIRTSVVAPSPTTNATNCQQFLNSRYPNKTGMLTLNTARPSSLCSDTDQTSITAQDNTNDYTPVRDPDCAVNSDELINVHADTDTGTVPDAARAPSVVSTNPPKQSSLTKAADASGQPAPLSSANGVTLLSQPRQQPRIRCSRIMPSATRTQLARAAGGPARKPRSKPNTTVIHAVTLTHNDLKDYPERTNMPKDPWLVQLSLADCASDDETGPANVVPAAISAVRYRTSSEDETSAGILSPSDSSRISSSIWPSVQPIEHSTNNSIQNDVFDSADLFSSQNSCSANQTKHNKLTTTTQSSRASSGSKRRAGTADDMVDNTAHAKSSQTSDAGVTKPLLERRYGLGRSSPHAKRKAKYPDAAVQTSEASLLTHDLAVQILDEHYPHFDYASHQRRCEFCHHVGLYELWPASCRFCSLTCSKQFSRKCQSDALKRVNGKKAEQINGGDCRKRDRSRNEVSNVEISSKRLRTDFPGPYETVPTTTSAEFKCLNPEIAALIRANAVSTPVRDLRTNAVRAAAAVKLPDCFLSPTLSDDKAVEQFPVDREVILGLENKHVDFWTKEEVAQYIASFVFHVSPDVPQRFLSDCIDGQALFMLEKDMLTSAMSIPLGHALKINYAIEALRKNSGFVDLRKLRIPLTVRPLNNNNSAIGLET